MKQEESPVKRLGPAPASTTPCVRVLAATSTSGLVGKPMQLLAVPKKLTAGGSNIAIRLSNTAPNSVSRPIFIAGGGDVGHVSADSSQTQIMGTKETAMEQEVVTTIDAEGEDEPSASLVEDIEEGEAPGLCAVCCQLEPPGFDPDASATNDSDCQVVDWAHCDYCNRWVHLNSECSRDAVISDSAFMCALCRGYEDGDVQLKDQKVEQGIDITTTKPLSHSPFGQESLNQVEESSVSNDAVKEI
ncbi:unnamed protein product [Mesocestoides corti]|uniref:CW-type domain-containing protein n=1 Tax=Mesocestoides corti TaxID=53468 RepID=A0A0R3ULG4_MESCO|nr:unnamed protein product [Mesocestoides corti]